MTGRIGLRLARALIVTTLTVLCWAQPARAHTSLVESDPPDRARLSDPPPSVRLRFSQPVDPASVTLRVLDVGGRHYDGTSRTTTGLSTNVIQFALPPLPRGTVYGLTWQSVGPDGHRVAGEIVVGVGYVSARDVTLASFRSVRVVEWTMDVLGAVGRFVWYVGLSLSIGAVYGLWWLSRSPGTGSGTTPSARFAGVTRRVLAAGLWVALAGAAVRWLDAIAVRLGSIDTHDGLLRRIAGGAAR